MNCAILEPYHIACLDDASDVTISTNQSADSDDNVSDVEDEMGEKGIEIEEEYPALLSSLYHQGDESKKSLKDQVSTSPRSNHTYSNSSHGSKRTNPKDHGYIQRQSSLEEITSDQRHPIIHSAERKDAWCIDQTSASNFIVVRQKRFDRHSPKSSGRQERVHKMEEIRGMIQSQTSLVDVMPYTYSHPMIESDLEDRNDRIDKLHGYHIDHLVMDQDESIRTTKTKAQRRSNIDQTRPETFHYGKFLDSLANENYSSHPKTNKNNASFMYSNPEKHSVIDVARSGNSIVPVSQHQWKRTHRDQIYPLHKYSMPSHYYPTENPWKNTNNTNQYKGTTSKTKPNDTVRYSYPYLEDTDALYGRTKDPSPSKSQSKNNFQSFHFDTVQVNSIGTKR